MANFKVSDTLVRKLECYLTLRVTRALRIRAQLASITGNPSTGL